MCAWKSRSKNTKILEETKIIFLFLCVRTIEKLNVPLSLLCSITFFYFLRSWKQKILTWIHCGRVLDTFEAVKKNKHINSRFFSLSTSMHIILFCRNPYTTPVTYDPDLIIYFFTYLWKQENAQKQTTVLESKPKYLNCVCVCVYMILHIQIWKQATTF